MMVRSWIQPVFGSFAAHALHAVLLLIPTIGLVGIAGIDVSIVVFVVTISVAAICEGLAISQPASGLPQAIKDAVSIRMASIVGPLLLGVFWLAQIEHHFVRNDLQAIQVLGLLGAFGGIGLRVTAIRSLGTQFVSDIRVSGPLVKDGVYRWMRHPSEVGLLLIGVGGPLLLGALWTAVGAILTLVPISLWRMQRENAAICRA